MLNYDREISRWRRRLPRHLRDCVRFGHDYISGIQWRINNGEQVMLVMRDSRDLFIRKRITYIIFSQSIRSLPRNFPKRLLVCSYITLFSGKKKQFISSRQIEMMHMMSLNLSKLHNCDLRQYWAGLEAKPVIGVIYLNYICFASLQLLNQKLKYSRYKKY